MTTEETIMERERQSRGIAGVSRAFLMIVALIGFDLDNATRAADVSKSDTATEHRVQALIPDIEACPLVMLWTAPPPARECHGYGCC
jgi:hypothetical protein